MATFQSPGIGSGLDVNSIVTQLVAIERFPIDRLDNKQAIVNAQISAYGSLKSKISDFQTSLQALSNISSFQVFSSVSNDEDVFTATADDTAALGNYSINVLALAVRDKIATQAYTDTASIVGEGTLTLSAGTDSFDVVIDGTNNTLAGIRDAINVAADNTGVTATIVTDDNGAQLVLSTDETGTDNALTITVSGDTDANNTDDSGLSALAYDVGGGVVHRAAISTAADATVEIDGFTITSSSNTISGALQGVSVTVKSIGSSTLELTRDDEKITESVQSFVDAYNALRDEIDTQRQGQLEADSTLLTIERQLSDILNSGSSITGSNFSYLVEVGLSTNELGRLEIDSSDLTSVLDSDFQSFANLFAAQDEGIVFRLEALADSFLDSNGLIDAREDGLKTQIDSIEDQKLRLEERIVSFERRLRAQFTALDTLIATLTSTGNFLTQQLSTLPAANQSS